MTVTKRATVLTADRMLQVEPVLPTPKSNGPACFSLHLDTPGDLGSFQMKTTSCPGFAIYQAEIKFNYNTKIESSEPTRDFVGLALMTSGKGSSVIGCKDFSVCAGQSVFTFNPSVTADHVFYSKTPSAVTYLEMEPEYFTELFLQEDRMNDNLLPLSRNVRQRHFFSHSAAISHYQQRIITDITNCPLTGSLAVLMLEASLQQIFALQLASLGLEPSPACGLSVKEKDVAYAVREYLDRNFRQEHSLESISRHFGINQTKLKRLFRTVFDMPVIEYVHNRRLEYARTMLLEKAVNVTEAAAAVGYRYPQHFTTAFRRKFGISPSQLA